MVRISKRGRRGWIWGQGKDSDSQDDLELLREGSDFARSGDGVDELEGVSPFRSSLRNDDMRLQDSDFARSSEVGRGENVATIHKSYVIDARRLEGSDLATLGDGQIQREVQDRRIQADRARRIAEARKRRIAAQGGERSGAQLQAKTAERGRTPRAEGPSGDSQASSIPSVRRIDSDAKLPTVVRFADSTKRGTRDSGTPVPSRRTTVRRTPNAAEKGLSRSDMPSADPQTTQSRESSASNRGEVRPSAYRGRSGDARGTVTPASSRRTPDVVSKSTFSDSGLSRENPRTGRSEGETVATDNAKKVSTANVGDTRGSGTAGPAVPSYRSYVERRRQIEAERAARAVDDSARMRQTLPKDADDETRRKTSPAADVATSVREGHDDVRGANVAETPVSESLTTGKPDQTSASPAMSAAPTAGESRDRSTKPLTGDMDSRGAEDGSGSRTADANARAYERRVREAASGGFPRKDESVRDTAGVATVRDETRGQAGRNRSDDVPVTRADNLPTVDQVPTTVKAEQLRAASALRDMPPASVAEPTVAKPHPSEDAHRRVDAEGAVCLAESPQGSVASREPGYAGDLGERERIAQEPKVTLREEAAATKPVPEARVVQTSLDAPSKKADAQEEAARAERDAMRPDSVASQNRGRDDKRERREPTPRVRDAKDVSDSGVVSRLFSLIHAKSEEGAPQRTTMAAPAQAEARPSPEVRKDEPRGGESLRESAISGVPSTERQFEAAPSRGAEGQGRRGYGQEAIASAEGRHDNSDGGDDARRHAVANPSRFDEPRAEASAQEVRGRDTTHRTSEAAAVKEQSDRPAKDGQARVRKSAENGKTNGWSLGQTSLGRLFTGLGSQTRRDAKRAASPEKPGEAAASAAGNAARVVSASMAEHEPSAVSPSLTNGTEALTTVIPSRKDRGDELAQGKRAQQEAEEPQDVRLALDSLNSVGEPPVTVGDAGVQREKKKANKKVLLRFGEKFARRNPKVRQEKDVKQRKRFIAACFFIVAFAVATAAVYLFASRNGQLPGTNATPQQTSIVYRGDFSTTVAATGTTAPATSVGVLPAIDGIVENLVIVEGSYVTAGEQLFTVRNASLDNMITTAQGQVTEAEAALTSATAAVSQAQTNYESAWNACALVGNWSTFDEAGLVAAFNSAETKRREAQANLTSAQATLAAAQTDAMERGRVTAPISGNVVLLTVMNGSSVPSAATAPPTTVPAVEIADLSSLRVTVEVSEAEIAQVMVGQMASVIFPSIPGLQVTATVTNVASTPSPPPVDGTYSGVTYAVELMIAAPDPNIRPGMAATAVIITQNVSNCLIVPSSSVISEVGADGVTHYYVTVVSNSETGSTRRAEVGIISQNESETAVWGELGEGETIVLDSAV